MVAAGSGGGWMRRPVLPFLHDAYRYPGTMRGHLSRAGFVSADEKQEKLAEREGFEPSVELPLHTLSKRAPSTTRPSLRRNYERGTQNKEMGTLKRATAIPLSFS